MSRTDTDTRLAANSDNGTDSNGSSGPDEAAPRRRRAVGPQQVLALLGGLAVIASGFFEWVSSGAGFFSGAEGRQIPLEFLWDRTPDSADPSLLIALIPIGVVAIASALWFASVGLRVLSGLAALVVVGAFVFQLSEVLDAGPNAGEVYDFLGLGWYLAVIGGFLTLIAATVPMWATRRREAVPTA